MAEEGDDDATRTTPFQRFFGHLDMLHDADRNAAYDQGIAAAVASLGAGATALDIGTGSGLLALLARKHGIERVTAIEAVDELAAIAARNFSRSDGATG